MFINLGDDVGEDAYDIILGYGRRVRHNPFPRDDFSFSTSSSIPKAQLVLARLGFVVNEILLEPLLIY